MATATRTGAGAYTTLWTHVLDQWLTPGYAEDIISRHTPTLNLLWKNRKRVPLGPYANVRLLDKLGNANGAFQYYDALTGRPQRGAQAAQFQSKMYYANISMSLQEELDYGVSDLMSADRIKELTTQEIMGLSDTLAQAVFQGTNLGAKHMLGFEQELPAFDHEANDGTTASALARIGSRFRVRQQNGSTYGGVDRADWTSATAGGTGWEANSVQMVDNADNIFRFHSTEPYGPDKGLAVFYQMLQFTWWGAASRRIVVGTQRPYDDYMFAVMGKTLLTKDSASTPDAQPFFANLALPGATFYFDEYAAHSGGDDVTAGNSECFYIFDPNYSKLWVDPRAEMKLTKPRVPEGQEASTRRVILRCLKANTNPRTGACGFNYFDG